METLQHAEKMTSKERVLTTFAHQEPDRVPISYFANGGIDQRLKDYYKNVRGDNRSLGIILGVDFRGAGAAYKGPKLHAEVPGRNVDSLWGIRTRQLDDDP